MGMAGSLVSLGYNAGGAVNSDSGWGEGGVRIDEFDENLGFEGLNWRGIILSGWWN